MALDVATLPLILYRKVYNNLSITLRENHTHSYLVLLLCHSYSIFFISNVFSTCYNINCYVNLVPTHRLFLFPLQAIEKTHHHVVDDCFTALLEHWLKRTSPPPTWSALINALKSPSIGYVDLANEVEAMYVEMNVHSKHQTD